MALWRRLKHCKVSFRGNLFFTNCFFVILSLSRVGRYICLVKGKNGIQPFPASGSPTAGFSLALKCERRQRVAALLYPKSFPPKQKDTFADVLLFWRSVSNVNRIVKQHWQPMCLLCHDFDYLLILFLSIHRD